MPDTVTVTLSRERATKAADLLARPSALHGHPPDGCPICNLAAKLRAALSQAPEGEAICERCEGDGEVYEVIAATPNGDEYGTEPCPDCQPYLPTGLSDQERERLREIESFDRIAEVLDSEFRRQAKGGSCSNDYQRGFDAGIREVKKVLASPNVRAHLTDTPSQPDALSVADQSQGSVDGLVEAVEEAAGAIDVKAEGAHIVEGWLTAEGAFRESASLVRTALANHRGDKQ